MGVQSSTVINVTIPAANVRALAQTLREWADADMYGDPVEPGATDASIVGTWLPTYEGNTDNDDEYFMNDDGSIIIEGGFYGKQSFAAETIATLYATHGATGTIDVEAEGDLYRVRLKDGKATYHVGVITYPSDMVN
jgi:hypothetical protein